MSSEEAPKVSDPPSEEDEKDNAARENADEKLEGEEGSELSKIVETQTIHEKDVVEDDTINESNADEETAPAEEEAAEEEEEKPRKLTVDDIKTAPMDFRFPTTNQAKHCFTRYVEYHKCIQAKGEDNPDCQKFARYYRSLCPGEWIDKWNEERENGTFPGPL